MKSIRLLSKLIFGSICARKQLIYLLNLLFSKWLLYDFH